MPFRVCCCWRKSTLSIIAHCESDPLQLIVLLVSLLWALPMDNTWLMLGIAKTQSLGECIYSMKIHSWKGSFVGNSVFLVPNIPTQGRPRKCLSFRIFDKRGWNWKRYRGGGWFSDHFATSAGIIMLLVVKKYLLNPNGKVLGVYKTILELWSHEMKWALSSASSRSCFPSSIIGDIGSSISIVAKTLADHQYQLTPAEHLVSWCGESVGDALTPKF